MHAITLTAAILALLLTLAVLWSNPYRASNCGFALVSFVQTAWLGCLYRAQKIGSLSIVDVQALEWWLRTNAAVVSFLPAAILFLKGSIMSPNDGRLLLFKSIPIVILSSLSAWACYTPSFVYVDSHETWRRGLAYYMHSFVGLYVYSFCLICGWMEFNRERGIRRIELQILALNIGGSALLIGILNAVGNFTSMRIFNRASVLLVFLASVLTACSLLPHRIFNIHDLVLQFARRLSFFLVSCLAAYVLWWCSGFLIAEPFGLLLSIGVCAPLAVWFDRKSRVWLDADGESRLSRLRRLVLEIGRAEWRSDRLVEQLEVFLCMEFGARSCHLCLDHGDEESATIVAIRNRGRAFVSLCELGWATPESLSRRRNRPGFPDLQHVLESEKIGLIVSVPRNSLTPSLILALGMKRDDWPYTFPEVRSLQALALVIDNLLTRSRLVTHASTRTRMDNMAIMSKGLAHDLRNLITPVSSFVAQSGGRFSPGSPDADVQAAALRSIGLVDRYLRDALSYSDDIEPRFEATDLASICSDSREILADRAHGRGVTIRLNCTLMAKLAMDGGLIQRLVTNLIANGVDACAPGQTVEVECVTISEGRIRIQVRDNGCGIPPENLSRIFEPHFTTKEFVKGERGFGIGLTLCRKIALLHGGTISVESVVGRGTLFTVDLPATHCSPSTRGMPEVVKLFDSARTPIVQL